MSSRNNYYVLHLIFLLFFMKEISVNSLQIRVENKGAYLARVLVRYHDSKGEEKSSNSGSFPAFRTSVTNIDNDVRSIEIEVQTYAFINTLRTIFKTNNPCPHTRCFVVWGTVFKAEWGENCCQ